MLAGRKGFKVGVLIQIMKKGLWILGIVLALTAAGLMFEGSILGENTTGIAIVIFIIGLALIATNSPWKVKKK